jgi:hypothetical protein
MFHRAICCVAAFLAVAGCSQQAFDVGSMDTEAISSGGTGVGSQVPNSSSGGTEPLSSGGTSTKGGSSSSAGSSSGGSGPTIGGTSAAGGDDANGIEGGASGTDGMLAGCKDAKLNGKETGLDCGGGDCPPCDTDQLCKQNTDCLSERCLGGICARYPATGLPLNSPGWVATASDSAPYSDPSSVLDRASPRTWTSGVGQSVGMWFEIDMGKPLPIYGLDLKNESAPDDAAALMDIYISLDGTFSDPPIAAGLFGCALTSATFQEPQLARYIRLVVSEAKASWWTIDSLVVRQ